MNKALFLDRDGIINVERGEYTYKIEDFRIMPGIIEVLETAKSLGYLRIVITNQAGIAKGLYSHKEVRRCHDYFQEQSLHLIDAFYYAPGHPSVSESLSRKPDSLMFEKAISHFNIAPASSWMVGDKERDLIPAKKLGIKTMLLGSKLTEYADHQIESVMEIPGIISYSREA